MLGPADDILEAYEEFVKTAQNGAEESHGIWGGPGEETAQLVFSKKKGNIKVVMECYDVHVVPGKPEELQKTEDVTELFTRPEMTGDELGQHLDAMSIEWHTEYNQREYDKGVKSGRLREMSDIWGEESLDLGLSKEGESNAYVRVTPVKGFTTKLELTMKDPVAKLIDVKLHFLSNGKFDKNTCQPPVDLTLNFKNASYQGDGVNGDYHFRCNVEKTARRVGWRSAKARDGQNRSAKTGRRRDADAVAGRSRPNKHQRENGQCPCRQTT